MKNIEEIVRETAAHIMVARTHGQPFVGGFLRSTLTTYTKDLLDETRRGERISFVAILTALREHGSKSRSDLERSIEMLTKAITLTDKPLMEALASIKALQERISSPKV